MSEKKTEINDETLDIRKYAAAERKINCLCAYIKCECISMFYGCGLWQQESFERITIN